MMTKVSTSTRFFLAASLSLMLVRCGAFGLRHCFGDEFVIMMKPGGVHNCKGSVHNRKGSENGSVSLGQFAVQEHNQKENTLLEFVRVLAAKEQVVAGKLYHLTLEVIDAGKNKIYEAKVWVKPWRNFKQLQEFKPAPDVQSSSPSDLGAKHDNS